MAAEIKPPQEKPIATRRPRRLDIVSLLPFVVFFVVYALMPRFAGDKLLTTLIYIGIYAMLALGLNLLMGYAGQISLGHAAFFGLGAYTSAILTVRPIPGEVIPGFAVGVGIMTGSALLLSLTRATGWKLAAGVAGLLVMSWVVRLTHSHALMSILIYTVGMALIGLVTRLGWWKSALSGIASALMIGICHGFLARVLERGSTSPWTAMFVGVFFTGLIAYLIGGQVLRLKGHYLAMATLAFGIIVEIVFRQWTAVTGGSSDGIYGITAIKFLDSMPRFIRGFYHAAGGGSLSIRQEYFYLVWGFVFLALILAVNIVRSRVGRAFRAVHGSESAAESLGVDTGRYKVQVFVLSAALASIAGSLHAHNAGIGYINPSEFNFLVSVQLVAMVVIGGMASVWGALFGAAAIQLLKNWVLNLGKSDLGFAANGFEPLLFGAILIIVMIVMPQGIVRGVTDFLSALWRTARKAARIPHWGNYA